MISLFITYFPEYTVRISENYVHYHKSKETESMVIDVQEICNTLIHKKIKEYYDKQAIEFSRINGHSPDRLFQCCKIKNIYDIQAGNSIL